MTSVALGADHAGWELKEALKAWLFDQGHQVLDFGTHCPDPVDYPDYAAQVAEAVAVAKGERGLLVCGTGFAGGRHSGRGDKISAVERRHTDRAASDP